MTKHCPYCGGKVLLMDSDIIYNGRSYGLVYICENYGRTCSAFVGVHKGTKVPLGTLADKNLRELRKQCHSHFDQLWKSGQMKRAEAYHWLHKVMNLSKRQAHIAKFDTKLCLLFLDKIKTYATSPTPNAILGDRGEATEGQNFEGHSQGSD